MDKLLLKLFNFNQQSGARLWATCRLYSGYEAEPYLYREVRRKDVLAKNPNQLEAVMNGPDYTYVDGRPTPYGTRHLRRMEKQQEYTAKIIQLTREVDTAKATHKRHLLEKERQIADIIDSKLKPKGRKTLD